MWEASFLLKSLAETISVEPQGVVIVEGVGSTRPELRDYYGLRIWVETPEDKRWQRQIDRRENSIEDLHRWAASERYYLETFRPQEWADWVIVGAVENGSERLGGSLSHVSFQDFQVVQVGQLGTHISRLGKFSGKIADQLIGRAAVAQKAWDCKTVDRRTVDYSP